MFVSPETLVLQNTRLVRAGDLCGNLTEKPAYIQRSKEGYLLKLGESADETDVTMPTHILNATKKQCNQPHNIDPYQFIRGYMLGSAYYINKHTTEKAHVYLNPEVDQFARQLFVQYAPLIECKGNTYKNKLTVRVKPLQSKTDGPILILKKQYKRLPHDVLYSDLTTTKTLSFLSGLLSSHVSANPHNMTVTFRLASELLIRQMQIVLAAYGVKSTIHSNNTTLLKYKEKTYTCKTSFFLIIPSLHFKKITQIFLLPNKITKVVENYTPKKNTNTIHMYRTIKLNTTIQTVNIKPTWGFNVL